MNDAVRVRAVVERKADSLPRYVVVPGEQVAGWGLRGSTVVQLRIAGTEAGRRTLERWGRDDPRWFIDLPETVCRRAGVDTGDTVTLTLTPASTALPAELLQLIDTDPAARRAWDARSDSERRMLAEQVRAAKQATTRARRAARALLGR